MADLGIAHRPREEHAAYIASWLPVLKSDPRAIFTAAGKAQQAADWMHAQQPRPPQPDASSLVPSRREGEGRRAGRDGPDEAGREAPGRPVAENLPWPSRKPRSP